MMHTRDWDARSNDDPSLELRDHVQVVMTTIPAVASWRVGDTTATASNGKGRVWGRRRDRTAA